LDAYDKVQLRQSLVQAGAIEIRYQFFGDDSVTCSDLVGQGAGKPGERSMITAVLRFKNQALAANAFDSGVLGFRPVGLSPGQGLTKGAATGLGDRSFVSFQTSGQQSTYVATWQSDVFVAMVASDGVSRAASDQMTQSLASTTGKTTGINGMGRWPVVGLIIVAAAAVGAGAVVLGRRRPRLAVAPTSQRPLRPDVREVWSGERALRALERGGSLLSQPRNDGTVAYRPVGGKLKVGELIQDQAHGRQMYLAGVGFRRRPDGTLDPSLSIAVSATPLPQSPAARRGRCSTCGATNVGTHTECLVCGAPPRS
jgi:hypothetical protein